ncbi:Tail Collar domain protein [Dickeya parazeae Ech586]|uniref:Tail Collar domain protein n=2 Tax=Dickeya TaxID=204037 RepID=D2BYI2_DICZ5|nr:phage tail protein [Dickeya parazeae]ACZ76650.1 Tail Collar domain protein [Dickeya parazeae Ech586]
MSTKYFALLTNIGAAKLANATALGSHLAITQMAVGDGGGSLPTPTPAQTKLVNEKRRAPLNALSVDPQNTNQIIAEQVIPETEGGWWIREIGLYDSDGDLIAVANCADTYKPQLQEGSGRVQTVRMILIVNSADAITLKIDPAVVLATRQYVDDKAIEVKAYADSQLNAHVTAANPHPQYAPLNSPALTGVPSAPTADKSTNSTQLATTAFVKNTALLKEQNGADIADKSAFLANLGLSDTLKIADIVGIPLPWPQATPPAGWLKCNGQAFDKNAFPKLAQVYPGGVLPDLRGEFIRGWDDGRGVDVARELLSWQKGTLTVSDPNLTSVNVGTLIHGNNDSANTYKSMGFDIVNKADYDMLRAALNVESSGAQDLDSYGWQFGYGATRPRNIAFSYIVRAA